jgi:hypothetical protein
MRPWSRASGAGSLLLLGYLAVAVWWLWPIARDPWSHLIDPPQSAAVRPDLRLLVWVLAWDAHALATKPWSLFHANAFHPAPLSLAYSEHLLGYVPIFAPVYWLTHNPIFATNVLVLLLFALRGLAMFVFARLFVPSPAAVLAGGLYAFPAAAKLDVAMFHVQGFFYLPLALFFTARWLERARARDAVLLACLLFLQATTSAYLGFALAFAYGTACPFLLAGARARLDRRRIVGLACAVGAALLGAVLLALPYLRLKELGLVPEYGEAGLDPVGLVLSSAKLHWYLVEGGVGPIGYALAALALLPPWRGRVLVLSMGVALVVVGALASAGPEPVLWGVQVWSPYRLLMSWLPGFSTVRLPSRLTVVCQLGFALLAGMGAARVVDLVPRPVAWGLSAAALATALVLQPRIVVRTAEYPVSDAVPAVYRALAERGEGRPVLELPQPNWEGASDRMLLSSVHWLPIVDGYSGYPPLTDDYLHEIARHLPDEYALQRLINHVDIGWIVVHTSEMEPQQVLPWLDRLPHGLRPAGRYGDDLLFRVDRAPLRDRRALLMSAERTLEGRPREWLRGPCAGEIGLLAAPKTPWRRERMVPVEVRLRNDGKQTWPGAGVIPKKLVRVRVCFATDSGRGCLPALRPLASDVPPKRTTTARLLVPTPRAPGDYRLRLELVQVGGESLADCGVPPFEMPVRVE